MTEAEERRRFDYDHTGRTPQDYAIEHAGYMAEAAKHLMERINEEADARGAWESAEDDGEADLRAQTLDEAVEATGEAMRTMQTRIYEFEKRRDRALGVAPSQADQLVARWVRWFNDAERDELTPGDSLQKLLGDSRAYVSGVRVDGEPQQEKNHG